MNSSINKLFIGFNLFAFFILYGGYLYTGLDNLKGRGFYGSLALLLLGFLSGLLGVFIEPEDCRDCNFKLTRIIGGISIIITFILLLIMLFTELEARSYIKTILLGLYIIFNIPTLIIALNIRNTLCWCDMCKC